MQVSKQTTDEYKLTAVESIVRSRVRAIRVTRAIRATRGVPRTPATAGDDEAVRQLIGYEWESSMTPRELRLLDRGLARKCP